MNDNAKRKLDFDESKTKKARLELVEETEILSVEDAIDLMDEIPFSYAVEEEDVQSKIAEVERALKELAEGQERIEKLLIRKYVCFLLLECSKSYPPLYVKPEF